MTESGTARFAKTWIRPALLVVAVAAALIAVRRLGLGGRIGELRLWIDSLGSWGPVVYALVYGIATALAVPASVLTVAAGALFGSVVGVVVVSAGSTLGATLAFLLARWAARGVVSRWLAGNERFARLDAMTERHGAIVVAITRLVPLFPFTVLNYGFGLTRVPLATYVLWSWLGMIPGTILYVVGGDTVVRSLADGQVPWPLVGVLGVTGAGLAWLVRRARRTLAEREVAAAQGRKEEG